MFLSVPLTLLPILFIVFLMTKKEYAADSSGALGLVLTIGIAYFAFNTTLEVGLKSSAAMYRSRNLLLDAIAI